jgi:hypothetical protein
MFFIIWFLTACTGRFSDVHQHQNGDAKENNYKIHLAKCSSDKDIIFCDWGNVTAMS